MSRERYIAALVATALAILLAQPWEKDVVYGFQRDPSAPGSSQPTDTDDYVRTTEYFDSDGTRCEAWLYLPKQPRTLQHTEPSSTGQAQPPVVIMASGLGVQKDVKLPQLAATFAADGYAVFLFDYRSYGGSDGEPRQRVSPRKHTEDYWAALQHIRRSNGLNGRVNAARGLVLWGSSYSGGHALVTAARAGEQVAAVTVMEPYVSGRETRHRQAHAFGVVKALRLLTIALTDLTRKHLGLPRAYIKLVGLKGSSQLAMGQFEQDDHDLFFSAFPERPLGGWRNLVLAELAFEYTNYHPLDHVGNITCPVLLVAGKQDQLTPAYVIRKAKDRIGAKAEMVELDGTHISLYENNQLMPTKLEFLARVLPSQRAAAATPRQLQH